MYQIDFSNFTDTSVNCIEIYFYQENASKKEHIFDLNLNDNVIKNIEGRLKNPKISEFKSYHMNDKIYIYELQNDNQYVISKNMVNMKNVKRIRKDTNLLVLSYQIQKYHPYTFPCTNNIDYVSEYSIKEFKINNRITVNIKKEGDKQSAYIEYRHSENVEMQKINEIINKLLLRF